MFPQYYLSIYSSISYLVLSIIGDRNFFPRNFPSLCSPPVFFPPEVFPPCEIWRWREPVPTRVPNPNASEASYKPEQRRGDSVPPRGEKH